MITLEYVKNQLYLDVQDTSEDNYLSLLIKAATKHAEIVTNRKLITAGSVPPPDIDNALECTEDVQVAIMLLIGGWYENREQMVGANIKSIPFGFTAIMWPYKYIPM